MGAKCLILTCLNQQVLTEVGSGGEYKEPTFPNRNLLKVALDLEWGSQSDKSQGGGSRRGQHLGGQHRPSAMPALNLALRTG